LPAEWSEFTVRYRYRETEYRITVQRAEEDKSVRVDGIAQDDTFIRLVDDRRSHEVEVRVNARSQANASLLAI
jgi:cellobiose phosphorylase